MLGLVRLVRAPFAGDRRGDHGENPLHEQRKDDAEDDDEPERGLERGERKHAGIVSKRC